ncbi:MAG: FecR domain-containing protein [Tannerellaceae bacterium]
MEEQIKKYFQGALDKAEQAALLKQVEADDEWQKVFIDYKNSYALLALADTMNDPEANKRGYARFVRNLRQRKAYRILWHAASYAAAVLLLVLSTYQFARYQSTQELASLTNTFHVPAGQHVKLTLQDGTDVWLNAKSTLTYPVLFSGKERRVRVEGEAFFDVAKNKEKPFIVSSQGVDMKVLGTKFNVYSYLEEDYLQTSLIEGRLQVYFRHAESSGVVLSANEQVMIKGGSMKVTPILSNQPFLWKEGIYSFENELLINILKKLELYYDVKFVVKDPSIYQWEYTGKFRQRDGIDEILHMIGKIHKFKLAKDEENNVYTLSN